MLHSCGHLGSCSVTLQISRRTNNCYRQEPDDRFIEEFAQGYGPAHAPCISWLVPSATSVLSTVLPETSCDGNYMHHVIHHDMQTHSFSKVGQ